MGTTRSTVEVMPPAPRMSTTRARNTGYNGSELIARAVRAIAISNGGMVHVIDGKADVGTISNGYHSALSVVRRLFPALEWYWHRENVSGEKGPPNRLYLCGAPIQYVPVGAPDPRKPTQIMVDKLGDEPASIDDAPEPDAPDDDLPPVMAAPPQIKG